MRAYGAASLYWLTCNLHIGILVDNQTLSRASSSRNLLGSCRHDKVCTALGIWLTPPTFEAPTTPKCRYNATHVIWDLLTSDQCDRVEDRRVEPQRDASLVGEELGSTPGKPLTLVFTLKLRNQIRHNSHGTPSRIRTETGTGFGWVPLPLG